MKRSFICFALLLAFGIHSTFSQEFGGQLPSARIPAPASHYVEEYGFDSTHHPEAWQKLSKGLHVSFASPDQLYMRTEVPGIGEEVQEWKGTAWKGERLNAQILVWSPDSLEQVRFSMKDLTAETGQLIPSAAATLHLVRYVVSNYPYGAKDATCGESPYKEVFLMPDRFERFERFDLPGNSIRPVWLTLNIPETAAPGNYSGLLTVTCAGRETSLKLSIRVQNQVLPRPGQWKHRLDLWQNPWVVAWQNNLKPWSEEHLALLKKHLQLYADAGGSYITTYAVHSPWADNSYMIEGGMIEWIKTKGGSWKFDYGIFDQYVQLAFAAGINEAITVYTPIPWGNRFRYKEETTGNYIYESWSPESDIFKKNWNVFLSDLQKHLQAKGWFDKTYLGINENPMEQTLAAIKMIRAHSKKWKITYAGDWHPELNELLDDYCFLYGKESSIDVVEKRRAKGQTTTYYVCCNPPFPNNFVFSPPVEGRWLGWYTAAHGYDGFLRWAYDAWPADPLRDARHTFWPAGDCFLVYPGGNSCIRFEKLREGIADFEKIRLVKQKAGASTDPAVKSLLQELTEHLAVVAGEKDFQTEKITADVEKGKRLLDTLSDRLAPSGTRVNKKL